MKKHIIIALIFLLGFQVQAQFTKTIKLPIIRNESPLKITDSLWNNGTFIPLEMAARAFKIDNTNNPIYQTERSIISYDLKPLPDKPYFDFSDRNNFEAIYKTRNLAFYEALKNTASSQLYNPFSQFKQL